MRAPSLMGEARSGGRSEGRSEGRSGGRSGGRPEGRPAGRSVSEADPTPAPGSLFPDLLPVSHFCSRFCRPQSESLKCNSFAISNLATCPKKSTQKDEAKSLFSNILPISPCRSIFCQDQSRSQRANCLKINILGRIAKKIREMLIRSVAKAATKRKSRRQNGVCPRSC